MPEINLIPSEQYILNNHFMYTNYTKEYSNKYHCITYFIMPSQKQSYRKTND